MKLLKKILPLATIATVAGGSVALSIGSCAPDVKEYNVEIVQEENIVVSSTTFQKGNPLVVRYELTPNYELDYASSCVWIGNTPHLITNNEYFVVNQIDEKNGVLVVLEASSEKIAVDLKAVLPPIPETIPFVTGQEVQWFSPRFEETFNSSFATSEYLSVVAQHKEILAQDLYHTFLVSSLMPTDFLKDYQQINITVGEVDPITWKCSFSIEYIPKTSSSKPYQKLEIVDMAYTLVWARYGNILESHNYWIFAPLVFWINNGSSSLTASLLYLKGDQEWKIIHTVGEDAPIVYNYQTADASLTTLISQIADYQISYLPHYWYPENMKPYID